MVWDIKSRDNPVASQVENQNQTHAKGKPSPTKPKQNTTFISSHIVEILTITTTVNYVELNTITSD